MNKFTPGPWKISEELSTDFRIAIDLSGIAGTVLVERHINGHDECDMPNAHLICAAPDMYEALKGVSAVADRETMEFVYARTAIAKAEGKL